MEERVRHSMRMEDRDERASHKSKPNSAPPSELLLDNQPSRINDENRVPSQNSLPKESPSRNLINRIALPLEISISLYSFYTRKTKRTNLHITCNFTYDSIALTKKRIHFVTQKVHSEHSPTVSLSTIAILKQHRLPLDPTDLTPFKVWSLLKEKYGGRNIYNMRDVFEQWDMCYLNSTLTDYVNRVEKVLGEFKSIVVDEELISDPYRLLNKLRQLAKHDAGTARSLGSKSSSSNSNSSTALASNTGYKNKRPKKRPPPTTNPEYSCSGGKHDPRAPHPPEHCWTLHPEQREEYLAKKREKAHQAANATSTQEINNNKSPSPSDTEHAAPAFYCCTTALSSVAANTDTSTVLDSGASTHMFNSLDYFTTTHPVHVYIITGNGKTREELVATKKGTVSFRINNNKIVTLNDALYVPNLSKNLISFSQLITNEISVRRNGLYYEVIINKNEKLFNIDISNQLFEIAGNITPTYLNTSSLLTSTISTSDFDKWHN
ncbi:hypothetical protein PSHT_06717 [Puccinia striiformis]|uniref:Retrovirus-related Pol polyprotein from transposon TNT 1-94-like beta-barrel domain-containing protein n=1 Tax=Puccinia striiformis TaxID=27350 RepID=A0A2S4W3Q9_9BASI|nr:hypothetical protein PSHT_06717 [Puccinia striiformis]